MIKHFSTFFILCLSALVLFLLFFVFQQKSKLSLSALPISAEVEIEQNANDSTKSDIYLINLVDGKKIFFLSIKDLNYNHVQAAHYQDGHLYVITRTGGPEGYNQYPETWTDTLKYIDSNGNEKIIFSYRGLDYQMSPNEKLFVFFQQSMDDLESKVVFTDDFGTILHTLTDKELGVQVEGASLMPLVSTNNEVWIRAWLGSAAIAVIQINPDNFSHAIYRLDESGN